VAKDSPEGGGTGENCRLVPRVSGRRKKQHNVVVGRTPLPHLQEKKEERGGPLLPKRNTLHLKSDKEEHEHKNSKKIFLLGEKGRGTWTISGKGGGKKEAAALS